MAGLPNGARRGLRRIGVGLACAGMLAAALPAAGQAQRRQPAPAARAATSWIEGKWCDANSNWMLFQAGRVSTSQTNGNWAPYTLQNGTLTIVGPGGPRSTTVVPQQGNRTMAFTVPGNPRPETLTRC